MLYGYSADYDGVGVFDDTRNGRAAVLYPNIHDPRGLAADASGNLYLTTGDRLVKLSPGGP